MDSQFLDGVKEDIQEIKKSIGELATIAKKQAIQDERMSNIDHRVCKIEKDVSESWKAIRKIDMKCLEREPVVRFGLKKMENPSLSNDDWLTMFLGSATRNGVWILLTGLLVALVNRYVR